MRRLLLVLAATAAVCGAWSATAAACSIAEPDDPIRDPFRAAQIALTGKVTEVTRTTTRFNDRGFVAVLRVSRIYKGRVGRVVRITGYDNDGTCGYGPPPVRGEGLALYLGGRRTPFAVDITSRTSYRDLEIAGRGRSRRP